MVFGQCYKRNINGTYKIKQSMQTGTISELYTDDKKSKYSSNPNAVLKSAEDLMKSIIQKR